MDVLPSPVWVVPNCDLRCLHQQETQERVALLADVSQPLFAGARVLAGNKTQIASNLFSTTKTLWRPDDQYESKPREGTHSRMGHQPYHLGSLLSLLLDCRA